MKLEHQRRFLTTRAPLHSHFRTCSDYRMMPRKFRDDISNGPGVIMLRKKQADTPTDSTENNTAVVCARDCTSAGYESETGCALE